MLIVPLTADPDSTRQILLGSNILTLRTYYIPTPAQWAMDVTDVNGDALVVGLAMVPKINLLQQSPELTRTLGQFRVLPTTENDFNTSQDAIAPLWWFAPGELEALDTLDVNPQMPFNIDAMYSPNNAFGTLILDGSWNLDGRYRLNGIKNTLI